MPCGLQRVRRCRRRFTWEELDDPDLRPNRWTIRDVVERVEQVGDLFAPAQTDRRSWSAGADRLDLGHHFTQSSPR